MSGAAGVDVAQEALAALYARAGASDQDRQAWLTERLAGVTATEVRELHMGGEGYRQKLLKQKAQGILDPELHNRYVAWGNVREPIIAEWARARFAIVPETRIFHAADNPRFLASPDGIGVGFDGELVVDEIKTGKDDLAPWGDAFQRKGYLLQCMWVMRVTGARRCRFIWEQHDSDWQDRGGEFEEPLPLDAEPRSEWIEYDEALADVLEGVALAFLDDLDRMVRDLADGVKADIDDAIDTAAVNYLRFIEEEKSAGAAKKAAYDEILAAVGERESFSQEGNTARVTLTPMKVTEVTVTDEEAAKAAAPELWSALVAAQEAWAGHVAGFSRTDQQTSKPRLTITAIKQKETK